MQVARVVRTLRDCPLALDSQLPEVVGFLPSRGELFLPEEVLCFGIVEPVRRVGRRAVVLGTAST